MSGVLYDRGKQSRYQGSFKNELQECLGIMERIIESEAPSDCGDDEVFLCGSVSLASLNRMRKACGMEELPPITRGTRVARVPLV